MESTRSIRFPTPFHAALGRRGLASVLVLFVVLPLVRIVTDKVLIPGVKLNDELVAQEKPNVGAGAIEAFSYVAASMLVGWAIL